MRPAAYFFLCASVFDIEYLAAIYLFFFERVRWAVPPFMCSALRYPLNSVLYTKRTDRLIGT